MSSANTTPVSTSATWSALTEHFESVKGSTLREMFAEDPSRAQRYSLEAVGLFVDYSKNRFSDETLRLLLTLADESGLRSKIDAMFRGDKINITEDRSVLHVALRAPKTESIIADGVDVVPEVHAVLDKMSGFADRVRSGAWKGFTGKPIKTVVNIGIGGSDLGPVMAYEALRFYSQRSLEFPLCFKRRQHRSCGSDERSRTGDDALPGGIEDLHNTRNH